MLKKISMLLFIIISINTLADNKKTIKHRPYKPNPHSIFDVVPLNSPVKESVARFLIKTPKKFDIDEVSYQVKNSGRIFEKPRAYQKINLVDGPEGKELKINVSKLPPGFYQLLVKIKDKSRKEHHFKTKFKDHAMFVVDSSLQVPMPDPKINNATLLGVDSDKNGIRDDVQRWINEQYSQKPIELKLSAQQFAISLQETLANIGSKENSIIVGHKLISSSICFSYIARENNLNRQQVGEARESIKMMYLNTKDRIEAELKSNEYFHGQMTTIKPEEDVCDF